jgi:hypothetical protein
MGFTTLQLIILQIINLIRLQPFCNPCNLIAHIFYYLALLAKLFSCLPLSLLLFIDPWIPSSTVAFNTDQQIYQFTFLVIPGTTIIKSKDSKIRAQSAASSSDDSAE